MAGLPEGPEPRPGTVLSFVVTGCSRSGTGYTAQLLSAAGFPCGHERVFEIDRVAELEQPEASFASRRGFVGDSSFLAAPYLERLPAGTVVLHQLRDPIDVIRSHLGIRFFTEPFEPSVYLAENHPEFLAFVERHCPEVFRETGEVARCMRYWVSWNRMVERAEEIEGLRYYRYRVEDMDRELLRTIVAMLDGRRGDHELDAALASVPSAVNARVRDESATWDALPVDDLRGELERLSERYGYLPVRGVP